MGSAKFRTGIVTFANSADTDIVRITDGGFNVISGITTLGGNVNSTGNFNIDGTDHDFNGTIALDNVQVSAGATIEGNLTLTGSGSTSSIAGALQLTNVNVSGVHTSGFAVVTNDLTVNGNMTVNGTTTTLDSVVQEVDQLHIQHLLQHLVLVLLNPVVDMDCFLILAALKITHTNKALVIGNSTYNSSSLSWRGHLGVGTAIAQRGPLHLHENNWRLSNSLNKPDKWVHFF